MKTNRDQFNLQKVKANGKGLEAEFEMEEVSGSEVFYDTQKIKSSKIPHPDLQRILDALKSKMAEVHYINVVKELILDEGFKATKNQQEELEKKYTHLLSLITITGVAVSGKDDNKGVIITGKLKTKTGQEVAINSQRIKFNGTKYGFESDLEDLCIDLEREVYQYLFEGKKAQQELFGDDEDEPDFKKAAAGDSNQLDIEDVAKAEEALSSDDE